MWYWTREAGSLPLPQSVSGLQSARHRFKTVFLQSFCDKNWGVGPWQAEYCGLPWFSILTKWEESDWETFCHHLYYIHSPDHYLRLLYTTVPEYPHKQEIFYEHWLWEINDLSKYLYPIQLRELKQAIFCFWGILMLIIYRFVTNWDTVFPDRHQIYFFFE